MRHFINTNAREISLARSVSLLSPMTPRPIGAQAVGVERTDEFIFHSDGVIEAWSGADGYALRVTIGPKVFDTFDPITAPGGWSGVLDFNDAALLSVLAVRGKLIGDFFQCSTVLTVEVTGPGPASAVYYQAPVILRAVQYQTGEDDDGVILYLRPTFYSAPAVTGLASAVADVTKLGGLSGLFEEGSTVQLLFPDGVVVLYTRVASVEAENVPWLVRPWNYDPDSNAYQWRIDSVTRFGQSCTYNAETGRWHYLVASGPPDAVTVGADQTGVALPA